LKTGNSQSRDAQPTSDRVITAMGPFLKPPTERKRSAVIGEEALVREVRGSSRRETSESPGNPVREPVGSESEKNEKGTGMGV